MEKKSILEKFGLVEKVDDIVDEEIVNDAEKKLNTELDKVTTKSKVESKEEINFISESDDPIAKVKNKKLLQIEEIYKNYDIDSQGINSLSIVESFQKALPDYLPAEVKRQSILNIIISSNVKVENLVKDGNDKLKCLNEFSQLFTNDSTDMITKFENEIEILNKKINNYKIAIENMKNLHNEQNFMVKYEIDKINNIMQFLNNDKTNS
ncbi:hypothetical protein [Sedimentibacter sp. MB31-C6]|uniref:hypothetical protein n=1 Tax=Sedimentibacter sp. MB31-C6 TaxID=3109366 RepID=UPI002DDCB4F6|nr:hypothetical protein [Sedimentibacter sp. MB36-C1]WSI03955.1 hypothetical protein U8307_13290 [Sedimentibacter sp. MB36-C1]